MSAKRIWHKGPPPFIGWWNASSAQDPSIWRWWNGKIWSWGVDDTQGNRFAADYSAMPALNQERIRWTYYWPKNAQVPRVKP